MEDKLTHKGWMLFCPVYMGNVETDNPLVVPRHWILYPLGWLAIEIQKISIGLYSLFQDEDYEPAFWFMITGELK